MGSGTSFLRLHKTSARRLGRAALGGLGITQYPLRTNSFQEISEGRSDASNSRLAQSNSLTPLKNTLPDLAVLRVPENVEV